MFPVAVYSPAACAGLECRAPVVQELSTLGSSLPSKRLLIPCKTPTCEAGKKSLKKGTRPCLLLHTPSLWQNTTVSTPVH